MNRTPAYRTLRRLAAAFLLVAAFGSASASADDPKAAPKKGIEGYWLGTLRVEVVELRIGFEIRNQKDGKLTAAVKSIDQGNADLPVGSVAFAEDSLTIDMPTFKATYTGKLRPDGDTIDGEFKQTVALPLVLKRQAAPPKVDRPQLPKKPYPYVEEELTFPSRAKDVVLAGTLTKPKGDGPFPVAVLISGSGPQDRDESLMGHKPFLVLADHLTRKGIAVLRYDDRGTAKSTGDFAKSTTADFADDAAGAVAFLKARKDVGRIGLIGHSEGGIVAPMVAAGNADVAFVVLLAGPGTTGEEVMIAQGQMLVSAMGGDEKMLATQKATQGKLFALAKATDEAAKKAARADLEAGLSEPEKAAIRGQMSRVTGVWFYFFLTHDPRPNLGKVKCPLLALNGERDLQVPFKENLAAIGKAARGGGNADVTTKALPGLNHLFQPAKTGLPAEYATIETTFDPAVLELISGWVAERTGLADKP